MLKFKGYNSFMILERPLELTVNLHRLSQTWWKVELIHHHQSLYQEFSL